MQLTYTLTPRMRISAGRTGEVQNTRTIHRHVPGSVVRGALGSTWWTSPNHRYRGAEPQATFDALFGTVLEVRDAIPVFPTGQGTQRAELLALSRVRVKYSQVGDQRTVGRHDLARGPLAACPMCSAPLDEDGWVRDASQCRACGTTFEYDKGGWDVDPGLVVASTRTALADGIPAQTVVRDADTGAVEVTGQLFTRLSMPSTVSYRGSIILRDGHERLPDAVEWLRKKLQFSVGGQRTTHGRVEWELTSAPQLALPTLDRVVLRLTSPTILVDDWGAPTLNLRAALQQVPDAGRIVKTWTRPTLVSGWHGVAGVPKPTEWALETGSTAVLEGWPEQALAALTAGLGIRRLEGYGSVELVDPHTLPTFANVAHRPVRSSTPSEAPAPAEADFLAILLEGVTRATRARVLNATLTAARQVAASAETGGSTEVVEFRVRNTLDLPWARDLGAGSRDAVASILRSPDISAWVRRIEQERRQ